MLRYEKFAKLLVQLLVKAESSRTALLVLNCLLHWMIPYIRGHGFRVVKAITNETQVSLPFKRRNLNHVGTLHACSSATGLELAAGLSVLRAMSPQQIKPVIKSMEIEYFKPGKAVAYARCAYDAEELRSQIGSQSPVVITMHSELADVDGVQLAKMISLWSIKIF